MVFLTCCPESRIIFVQVQKHFHFKAISVFKKKTLLYGKPAMTCFKYQVYLYGSESITYLNDILWAFRKPALWVIRLPPSPLQAALPPLYGSIFLTITHLEENYSMAKLQYLLYVKKQRENPNGWGTITCKKTIPEPRGKIGLKLPSFTHRWRWCCGSCSSLFIPPVSGKVQCKILPLHAWLCIPKAALLFQWNMAWLNEKFWSWT